MLGPETAVIAVFVGFVVLHHKVLGVNTLAVAAAMRNLLCAITQCHLHIGVEELEHQAMRIETFVDMRMRDLEMDGRVAARCSGVEAPTSVVSRNVSRNW